MMAFAPWMRKPMPADPKSGSWDNGAQMTFLNSTIYHGGGGEGERLDYIGPRLPAQYCRW